MSDSFMTPEQVTNVAKDIAAHVPFLVPDGMHYAVLVFGETTASVFTAYVGSLDNTEVAPLLQQHASRALGYDVPHLVRAIDDAAILLAHLSNGGWQGLRGDQAQVQADDIAERMAALSIAHRPRSTEADANDDDDDDREPTNPGRRTGEA